MSNWANITNHSGTVPVEEGRGWLDWRQDTSNQKNVQGATDVRNQTNQLPAGETKAITTIDHKRTPRVITEPCYCFQGTRRLSYHLVYLQTWKIKRETLTCVVGWLPVTSEDSSLKESFSSLNQNKAFLHPLTFEVNDKASKKKKDEHCTFHSCFYVRSFNLLYFQMINKNGKGPQAKVWVLCQVSAL